MIRTAVFQAHSRVRIPAPAVHRAVAMVLRGRRIRSATVTVVFFDSRRSRRLNREFLGHDYITDVLSFTLNDPPEPLEGELYVNVDRARQQAREYHVSFREEIRRLVIHGTLHLAGVDDRTARELRAMRRLEDHYLALLLRPRRTT
jgi:rRNA maturation RNase YbeY